MGNNDIKCTMYRDLKGAVDGFSKNLFQFFGGSRMVCCLFAAATTLAPVFIFLINGFKLGFIYIVIILLLRFFIPKASCQSVIWNTLLIIPQQFTLWKIIITASVRKAHKNLQWKGRNIYLGG